MFSRWACVCSYDGVGLEPAGFFSAAAPATANKRLTPIKAFLQATNKVLIMSSSGMEGASQSSRTCVERTISGERGVRVDSIQPCSVKANLVSNPGKAAVILAQHPH